MNRKVVYIIFGMILTVLIFLGIGYYTYLKVKTVDWVELMNAVHRSYEVSITYSVFVGIGTIGVVLNEMFIFNEAVSIIKLVLIAILLLSIIALKWVSKEA